MKSILDIRYFLIAPVVWFVMQYRKIRYGYVFRRIALTEGKFAIVDPDDYGKISRYSWHLNIDRYACSFEEVNGKRSFISMHAKILQVPPGFVVDHINNVRLDNRKVNLRAATRSENAYNRATRPHTSRFRGVYWNKGKNKWRVSFAHQNKNIHVGYFSDEIEAAKSYDEAIKEARGEMALLNFQK